MVKNIIQASLASSYQSDMKEFKVVNIDLGALVLGVGIMTSVSIGCYKESSKSVADSDNVAFYQTKVPNALTIDEKNTPLYLLVSSFSDSNYRQMEESFESHFKKDSDSNLYRYSFDKLAKALSNIQYKKAYVDIAPEERRVDFYLNIGHKILLTVSQVNKDVDDDIVMFSIDQNHETIAMDRIAIKELVAKIQQIQFSLNKT